VLPVYEEHSVDVNRVLTDSGREFCGLALQHPYELYLATNQIEHRGIEPGSPESNGFCERFHRTIQEEFFAIAFRKTTYESVAQLQADLGSVPRYRTPGPNALPSVPRWCRHATQRGGASACGLNLGEASGDPACLRIPKQASRES